jgi:hypothetical protein
LFALKAMVFPTLESSTWRLLASFTQAPAQPVAAFCKDAL